jgi:hypothetical protein
MKDKMLKLTWVAIMVISSFALGMFLGPKITGQQPTMGFRRPPPLDFSKMRLPANFRMPSRRR